MQIAPLGKHRSAITRTSKMQNRFLLFVLLVLIATIAYSPDGFLRGLIYFSLFYYLFDFIFYMNVVIRGTFSTESSYVPKKLDDSVWPTYTILCPMYKEQAVLPQFVKAMNAMDYPKDKLQILLLLEEDDDETIAFAQNMDLPGYFTIVVVPHSLPKTKPKACNYGLTQAKGKYVVIYDAEDIPDPAQLKMAATAHVQSRGRLGCVQAKLNFYNSGHNFMTKLFTLEYSLWFEVVLPGLMAIKAPIPLGGTSNHFPTALLRRIGAWDPYNVTEDADLGMRLMQRGFGTAVIDSTTMEEGNARVGSWIRQRSRWIKGYMQTHLVHSRAMDLFAKNGRWRDVLYMHIILGVRSFGLLFSALLLVLFIANGILSAFGIALFSVSGWLFYLLLMNFMFINLIYIYTYALGIAKRKQWELMPTLLIIPFYWFIMLLASIQAIYELILKPYYWQKTEHGLHLEGELAGSDA